MHWGRLSRGIRLPPGKGGGRYVYVEVEEYPNASIDYADLAKYTTQIREENKIGFIPKVAMHLESVE